jgi:hypothetical protein
MLELLIITIFKQKINFHNKKFTFHFIEGIIHNIGGRLDFSNQQLTTLLFQYIHLEIENCKLMPLSQFLYEKKLLKKILGHLLRYDIIQN